MKTDLNVRQILSMNAFEGKDQDLDPDSLLSHRLDNFGAASVLFYQEPIEMVSASGCWMTSADGIDYLDFYNNVPSVGHSHPKVINAITEQITKLNTNTRYLVGVVDRYLDKLKSTFPDNLDNILLCCTGSEANDLAMRLAMKRSGKTGFIVTETAYHGNTSLVTEVSPSALKSTPLKDNVIAVPPPCRSSYGDDIRGGFTAAVKNAIELLEQRGFGCAALLLTRSSQATVYILIQKVFSLIQLISSEKKEVFLSPMKCSPDLAGQEAICGDFNVTMSFRTWSPWANLWAMDSPWPV